MSTSNSDSFGSPKDSPETPVESASTAGSSEGGEDCSPRPTFMSIHRRNLNRITADATQNIRHTVPESRSKTKSWTYKAKDRIKEACASRTRDEWIQSFLPCYSWLRVYDWRSKVLTDILAGLTVGVMVVPQSMSYAKLAGLPVEYGLYSALFPVWAYALFGSSRQLAVGPVALVSLLLSTGLSRHLSKLGIPEDDPEYVRIYAQLAVQVSFLVGIMNIGMGILRLGFVTIFLSHAVVSGFTSGAAVLIGVSQLKHIFGVDASGHVLQETIKHIIDDISNFNYRTFLMGTAAIATLVLLKRLGNKYPKFKWARAVGPLLVTAVTITITWLCDLSKRGIPIVGSIPKGFPAFTAGLWTPIDDFGGVFQIAASITLIGFLESIAIAKQLASKNQYNLDSSLELIGLGMANFWGAMFQAYPVTGSFSRSAVNSDAGASSGISGAVTASLVGLVLLFLTPVFAQMPLAVLAAVVISGVLGLIDYREAMYLWKVHKFDFTVWMIAFLGTMFLGVEIGLAIAVVVSLLLITYESAYPHTAVLGRLPGTTVYRNVKQYPTAECYDGIVMVRIDAPIYFANTDNIRFKLLKYESLAEEQLRERGAGDVKYIILEMSPVSHVDASALHIFHDMIQLYKQRGIQMLFANPNVKVMDIFVTSGLADEVGRQHIFVSIDDAFNWALHEMDTDAISNHGGHEKQETAGPEHCHADQLGLGDSLPV